MRKKPLFFTLFVGTVLVVACSFDPAATPAAATPTVPEAGTDAPIVVNEAGPSATDGPATGGAWTSSACGTCATAQCKARRDACDGEPSCAAHAKCVDGCAASANGTPDAACINACPRGDSAAAAKLRAAFDTCVRQPGTACPACTVAPPPAVDILMQSCGASADPNECFKCEDINCCHTYQECVDEPECKQQLQPCLVACTSKPDYDACKNQCYVAHPKGVTAWARRDACLNAFCGVACNKGQPLDPCVECTTAGNCRNQTARCDSDHDCHLINNCVQECAQPDDTCIAKCKSGRSDDAGALFDAFLGCALTDCIDVCG